MNSAVWSRLRPIVSATRSITLVYRVAMEAGDRRISLREAALAEHQIVAQLGVSEIESIFDMGQSTGCCGQMVDCVVAQTEAWMQGP